jgi:hypothetical protein
MAAYETDIIDSEVQERLIKALSSCLPEDRMGLILVDKNHGCWASDPVGYDGLIQDTPVLEDMIAHIDDGDEPALTRSENMYLVGIQLLTPCCDYGYAILVLSDENHDLSLQNRGIIECLLNQMLCIAGLLELQDYQITL